MKTPATGSLWAGLVPVVAASGIALVAGFGLGRATAPSALSRSPIAEKDIEKPEEKQETDDSERMASKEAASAADVMQAAAINAPRQRDRALEDVLGKASLEEVKKALAWAEALPDGPMKKAALEKILERWGELDGTGATAYAMQVYEQTGNSGLLRDALEGWARKDPQGAITQLGSLELGDRLARDIRRDLVGQWTELNPAAAAGYASANRNTNNWGGLVSTVADEWAKRDPQAAATWAAGLPEGLDKRSAIYEAIRGWADSDLNGVATFVSAQPAGQSRDAMAGTLARQIGREDPAAGLKWAAMVADPGTQERAVAGALIDLYRRDTNQALQLLQSSSISAQIQQAVLNRMTNGGPWWR
ncbi:hypothetical protein EBT23_04240 [bacterium]|nr:hypothetical protein [bacterium]